MQMLYPIIRRVRRSLVVTEAGPDTQGTGAHGVPRPTEAAQPVAVPAVATEPKVEAVARIEPAKSSDEKVSTNTDAR